MYKNIVILIFLVLQACSKPLPEYLAKEQIKKEFKEKANANCALSYLDNSKDILVANIYFKDFKSDLSKEDKTVIKKVSEIYQECSRNILLVGHSSNLEMDKSTKIDGFVEGAVLSFERVKEVATEMQKNKIFGDYINVLFCGVSNNLVEEGNNKNANLYNQRVDIVFLNTEIEYHDFDCISTENKRK